MSDIFWLGRYTERTDYHARVIDANLLKYHEASGFEEERLPLWDDLLTTLSEKQNYLDAGKAFTEKDILYFLTFDETHINSIANSLKLARDNAGAVRERLPSYLWESINETFLEAQSTPNLRRFSVSPHLFYHFLKERIALFYGIADSSMMRLPEWHLLQLGRYLERIENSIRIIQMLVQRCSDQGDCAEELYTILNTVDGLEGYRRVASAEITFKTVCLFLILRPEFPRSLIFSLSALDRNIQDMLLLNNHAPLRMESVQNKLKRFLALVLSMEDADCQAEEVADFLQNSLVLCNNISHDFFVTVFNREESLP